jgi:hypothetical protein
MSQRSPRRSSRLAKKSPTQSTKNYELAGKMDDISCPYPKHKYSCEPMRRRCVKAPNDCLSDLEDYKRVKRQWDYPNHWDYPKKVHPKKVYATEMYVPSARPQSIKKALNPNFLAKLRQQAYPLRQQLSPPKRRSSPTTFWAKFQEQAYPLRQQLSPKRRSSPKRTKAVVVKRRSSSKRWSMKRRLSGSKSRTGSLRFSGSMLSSR